jgi:hypothetical protein
MEDGRGLEATADHCRFPAWLLTPVPVASLFICVNPLAQGICLGDPVAPAGS